MSAPLPDVSRLEDPALVRALGARLRAIGLDVESVKPIARICERQPEPAAKPMRRYHLRRRNDLLALAMRMFVFPDPVTRDEARSVLGEIALERVLEAGFVVPVGDGVASPFLLSSMGELYVLCDDLARGGEAVMGVSNTTAALCRAAGGAKRLERALDLGCGAGAGALSLAARTSTVVATDINPRALVFTRVNALLNGIDNIDARVGDMFAPVAGETFDLVLSQPPFVPQPDDAPSATFLYGGRRGDELPLRLFRELPPHLAPGGRALVLVDWPIVSDSLQERLRSALADPSLSVLLLCTPPDDLDDWSTSHALLEERTLDERFAALAEKRRAHFDRIGVSSLRLTFNVVVRDGRGLARTVDILPVSEANVQGAHVDALLATTELLSASDDELLRARVRLPAGAEIVERGARARVVFRELLPPVEVSRGAAMLTAAASSADSIGAALDALAAKVNAPREQMLAGVRQALSLDVLTPER